MTPQKLDVLFATFPYGGTGASSSEHPACRDFLIDAILECQRDERIGRVETKNWSDTPLTMTRNAAVRYAQHMGFDVVVMLDSDIEADYLLGRDPGAKPFFKTAFEFLYSNYQKGPHVVCAPYCGPPPQSPCYVFRWAGTCTDIEEQVHRLEMIPREEAAVRSGLEQCAAQPTGLIMFDVRAFDLIQPPYFRYEYVDQFETDKASTEDVACTRDISLAGLTLLGYSPIYVAWDCWAAHVKPLHVGKPKVIYADTVNESYKAAVLRGVKSNERLIFAQRRNGKAKTRFSVGTGKEGTIQNEYVSTSPFKLDAPKGNGLIRIGDTTTPDLDLKALEQVVRQCAHDAAAIKSVEVGSWVGESALAICRGMNEQGHLTCVDHWKGSPSDKTSLLAEKAGGDAVYEAFCKNLGDRIGKNVTVVRKDAIEAARSFHLRWFDFIFIDADHTYRATRDNIRAYLPLLRDGGTIAFHDYMGSFPGTMRAVDEAFGPCVRVEEVDGKRSTVASVIVTEEVRREYDRRNNPQQAEPEGTAGPVHFTGCQRQADEQAAEAAGTV